jgi:hypothetical protein
MGSWNETCGLSGLPITYETETLLFPLINGTYYRSGCSGFSYPTGLWQPMTLPLCGPYSDYGRIEKFECADLDLVKYAFMRTTGKVWSEGTEGEAHGTLHELERGKLTGTLYGQEAGPIGQELIRRDVWDTLLTLSGDRDKVREDARFWLTHVSTTDPETQLRDYFNQEIGMLEERGATTFFHGILAGGASPLPALKTFVLHQKYQFLTKDLPYERLEKVTLAFADVLCINETMGALRRAWGPQPGAGSQDIEFELHRDFADCVSAIAAKEIARYKDEEDE